jgi:GGDEF domain-containing protein
MREAFGTERGDEFMSLIHTLDDEAQGMDQPGGSPAGLELDRMMNGKEEAAPARPAAGTALSTVDQLAEVGGPVALRRDLMLEGALPSPAGPRFTLISIDVHPVAEVRARRGPAAADQLLATLVDALRVSLRPSDGIYRSGIDQLTLLLRGRGSGAGDKARTELESALRVALAHRGLPSVRLAAAV